MRLIRYLVENFRSVENSGWVDADAVTALIGVNESGKTNLLLPLWKLNPAREGEIQPTSDYPKKMFGEIRDNPAAYHFITAEFDVGDQAERLGAAAGITASEASVVSVKRFFDGAYKVSFPKHNHLVIETGMAISKILGDASTEIKSLTALKQEEDLKDSIVQKLNELSTSMSDIAAIGPDELSKLIADIKAMVPSTPAKTSSIVPRLLQSAESLAVSYSSITALPPGEGDGVSDTVVSILPKFVYYSNYGNLDSEIYLPHVVQNLQRKDLGAKEVAKARTLRVLFRFVRLEPKEILELGQDFEDPKHPSREPTEDEIAEIADKKRERSILLQSAGTTLTAKFKDWWKQGDYRFRFEADGNHFRIWVSDDRRPDEVELESRSTGLQWFLSFYLVFLVESMGEHKSAILLLDEPGLSLHPLAQRDLSSFFDSLSTTNQLLYTTHSPFLVDADRLERARKVYISDNGTTKLTSDLRYGGADPKQAGAAYAVHSALNLSVSESLLVGCQPVIVEGPSDQFYLTAIKSLLISAKKISPARELVFPPSGGSKTARVVAAILVGRDEKLPFVILDGDAPGKKIASELCSGLYAVEPTKVLNIEDFAGMKGAEVEDLFPPDFFASVVDRWERQPEVSFSDTVEKGKPIVPQVEAWIAKHGLKLPIGWKVDVAKRVKQQALTKGIAAFDASAVALWSKLFHSLLLPD